MVSAELDAVAVDEHSKLKIRTTAETRAFTPQRRTPVTDPPHADLQMSSRKHREELHDGTPLELCA